jgi:hypothetical protein
MAYSASYDHPTYTGRFLVQGGSSAAGTLAVSASILHLAAQDLWNVAYQVTAAGTGTGALARVINVSGTTTTTLATMTAGTSAIGSVVRARPISTATTFSTPIATAAADSFTYVTNVADATLAGRVAYEVSIDAEALLT